jgi:simple sugar transport system substrate-binding protein
MYKHTLSSIAAALAVGAAMLTGGCGGEASDGDQAVVGFSQVGAESDWRRANTDSIQSEAKKRGIDLQFADAQGDQQKQINAIKSFINQGVDVIAFSPKTEDGWEQVLTQAKRARIPVILTDRRVNVSDESLYATFIGSDFVEEGRRAARWVVANTDVSQGTVKIAELSGTTGSAPEKDRAAGFREIIKNTEGYEIVWSQSGDFKRSEGKKKFEAFLSTPLAEQVTVLYAHNDDMALGAIQAIKEKGVKPGSDIKIVSIDAVGAALKAIRAGELNCSVECNPMLGPQLFDLIEKVVAGEEVPKRVEVQESVFTSENVTEALLEQRKY